MKELVRNGKYSSLYLVEQINVFREVEKSKSELRHSDLLRKIEKEFEEEITERKISPSYYKDASGKKSKHYELDYEQSFQVLVSESRIVRKSVIEKLKSFQDKRQEGFLLSHEEILALQEMVVAAHFKEFRELARVKHLSTHLPNNPKGKDFGASQIARNTICGIDKYELEARLNKFNIKYTGVEKALIVVDKYELIRISIIDTMLHFGKTKEYAINIGNLAKELVKSRKDLTFTRIKGNIFPIPLEYQKTILLLK